MSPAQALMFGDVYRIRVRARNGVTREIHATFHSGQRVNHEVAGRYNSQDALTQQGGAYRWGRSR